MYVNPNLLIHPTPLLSCSFLHLVHIYLLLILHASAFFEEVFPNSQEWDRCFCLMSLKHSPQISFCSSPSHIINIKINCVFIYLTYWPMSSSWAKATSSLYQQHPAQCLECNINCGTWTEWAAETFLSPFLVLPSVFLSWVQHSQLSGVFPACCFLPVSLSPSWVIDSFMALILSSMENSLSRRPVIRKHAYHFLKRSSESVQSTTDVIKLVPAFEVPALQDNSPSAKF